MFDRLMKKSNKTVKFENNHAKSIVDFKLNGFPERRSLKMEDPTIERITVESERLVSISYNPKTFTLEIEFRDKNKYQYYGVAEYIFKELVNAPSKIRFINLYIKNCGYSFQKI